MQDLSNILSIKHPIILAPMFMVTNLNMIKSAIEAGATGALPAHNYRNAEQLRKAILRLKDSNHRPFGVNIIHEFQNSLSADFLQVCLDERVDFIISSLGDPSKIVNACKPLNIKVFADVVKMEHAEKAAAAGVDALIAVGNRAGGHAGLLNLAEFIPQLTEKFNIPVIAAGGVGSKVQFDTILGYGASGVSVGTAFIVAQECNVSEEYKQAIISASESDVVLTRRISGIPITVINTPYIKSLGSKPKWIERQLKNRKKTKRVIANIFQNRLLNRFQHKIIGPDYTKIFCAGPVVNEISQHSTIKEIVRRIAGVD